MAIRRPPISSPTWLYQDFLHSSSLGSEERFLQVKWDGEEFTRTSQTFDYSNPPYTNAAQRGGPIAAQIDYTIEVGGKIVLIHNWQSFWQDEYPLRAGMNYLRNCLYRAPRGYVIRVVEDVAYTQNGELVHLPNREPLPFWISEEFKPLTNKPNDYLYH